MLEPHDFVFVFRDDGRGSGGFYATGDFVRRDRRLELHFHHSLGLVTYHVGPVHVSHAGYMRELGMLQRTAYPGFSDDPLDGFRHLADDLARFAGDFLMGDGSAVARAAEREQSETQAQDQALMAGYVGDVRSRREAKRKFEARDWRSAADLLESLKYPDQMDAADRRRLEIARRRSNAS